MKIAKVIATAFEPRTVKERTKLAGNPLGYFEHSQNFPTKKSIIELINFNIEMELKCNPGETVDLIFVNNNLGWEDGNRFLDNLNGNLLRAGKIYVLHRANGLGRSYGSYNYAFKMLGDNYDYFIFTEDDIVVSRDGYASIGVENFLNTENCGFVAYQGLSDEAFFLKGDDVLAAHGGVGLTSANVLKDVVMRYEALPHADEPSTQNTLNIIMKGEIAFTNKIHKLGYRLTSIPDDIKLYDYAYDLMRGLNVKRFAPLPVKLWFKLKEETYKQKIIRSIYEQSGIQFIYQFLFK